MWCSDWRTVKRCLHSWNDRRLKNSPGESVLFFLSQAYQAFRAHKGVSEKDLEIQLTDPIQWIVSSTQTKRPLFVATKKGNGAELFSLKKASFPCEEKKATTPLEQWCNFVASTSQRRISLPSPLERSEILYILQEERHPLVRWNSEAKRAIKLNILPFP